MALVCPLFTSSLFLTPFLSSCLSHTPFVSPSPSPALLLLSYPSLLFVDEVKAAVVTKLGVKKLIDLMDAGARMMPAGEPVVQAAAQVLANIASKGNKRKKREQRREDKKR